MPDFDIDFCMDRRDEVIDYGAQKYGRDRVSQIITYGTMAAKAVVRDTGRILGHPYGFVDSIAKLIPLTLGISLDDALGESRSEEHTSELQSLMRISYAVFCLKKKTHIKNVTREPIKNNNI